MKTSTKYFGLAGS